MTTQNKEPVIVRVSPWMTPEVKCIKFEYWWCRAFGSLHNPATRTIAIVEERDE